MQTKQSLTRDRLVKDQVHKSQYKWNENHVECLQDLGEEILKDTEDRMIGFQLHPDVEM